MLSLGEAPIEIALEQIDAFSAGLEGEHGEFALQRHAAVCEVARSADVDEEAAALWLQLEAREEADPIIARLVLLTAPQARAERGERMHK